MFGFLWEPLSWLADDHLLTVSLHSRERKRKQTLWCLFLQTHHKGSALTISPNLITSQKSHLLIPWHWKLELQREFGRGEGNTNTPPMTPPEVATYVSIPKWYTRVLFYLLFHLKKNVITLYASSCFCCSVLRSENSLLLFCVCKFVHFPCYTGFHCLIILHTVS